MGSSRRRGLLTSSGFAALVAAVALTLVPAAFNSSTPDGLSAYVVANTRGPLPASGGIVRHFVHVINSNDFGPGRLGVRETLANAFVLNSVDLTTYRDGVQIGDPFPINAPPSATIGGGSLRDFAGRWPTTVTVDSSQNSCCIVGKPAIIPGENTVAFYVGQQFVDGEDNPAPGTYVFKYTLHGTLNDGTSTGTHVDLSATSPRITATG